MGYFIKGPDGRESGPIELETLVQWAQSGTLPAHAPVRDEVTGFTTTAGQLHELQSIYTAPDFSRAPEPATGTGAKGSALIPTGNPDALWGYYLGLASLLCVIGLLVAPFAFVKSFKGFKAYRQHPESYGAFHAVTGIILATVGTLANIALIVFFYIGLQPESISMHLIACRYSVFTSIL